MRIVIWNDETAETIFFVPEGKLEWIESLLALSTDDVIGEKAEIDSTNDLIYPAYGWVKV